MNQLVAFNQAILEASRWLETVSRDALSRLTLVRASLDTVREPLLSHIKAAETQQAKEETLYGD